jgi:cell division protein FtsA
MSVGRNALIAGLDVGSTKVCCFIARADEQHARVIGIGHQIARGMRNGTVIDMDAAEASIRAAVDAAERMASERINDVFVTLNAGSPESHQVNVEVAIGGHEVAESDIRRVLAQGRDARDVADGDRQVIHSIPVGFTIDGSPRLREPRGLYADHLGVTMHLVTAQVGPVRNIATCVARGHLGIAGMAVGPFASGLACLVEDEMDLGVTLVDCGGGTTSIAIFFEGALVYTDSIPMGGAHVTSDIARGLTTTIADAERLKTLYGTCLRGHNDDDTIAVPQVGETEEHSHKDVPRSLLTGIITPRVEEILELVRERIGRSGFDRIAGRRVVLTGGASQLQGIRELAARILDKQVRLGRPIRVAGLAEATGGPAFSACAGLLAYALKDRAEAPASTHEPDLAAIGRFSRIGKWLRANF